MHETGEKAEFDLGVIAEETGHPYRLQCEQAHLSRILAERLAVERTTDILYGSELIAIEQDAAGVTARFVQGSGERRLRARYLIGADGAQGITRKLAGIAFAGKTFPEATVLATTRFAFHEVIDGLSNVNYCWSARGNFALLRLPGVWRCSLYFDPSLSLEQAIEPARLQAQLRDIYPGETPFDIVHKTPYRVHQRIVEHYRRGRVVLAGDAAHLNSPSGGMGMNGGIHDAFNLTEKLQAIWDGMDDGLLDLYSRQRRPIAERQIISQANRNRNRMLERDPGRRRENLRELQAVAGDPAKARPYLLQSSMIDGLREAAAIT